MSTTSSWMSVLATLLLLTTILATAQAGVAQGTNSIVVENRSVTVDNRTSVPITLTAVPNGLQKYNLTVSLADSRVATIEGATGGVISGRPFDITTNRPDRVTFRVVDFSNEVQPDGGRVTLAMIQVNGSVAGSTELSVDVHELTDDNGTAIPANVSPGVVTVTADGLSTQLDRFDMDGDHQIGFDEVLQAIAAFNNGERVEGRSVDFGDVLDVIAAFNDGTRV